MHVYTSIYNPIIDAMMLMFLFMFFLFNILTVVFSFAFFVKNIAHGYMLLPLQDALCTPHYSALDP